jgi:hypothetical protein
VVRVFLMTGMREQEVMYAYWSDVSFAKCTVKVTHWSLLVNRAAYAGEYIARMRTNQSDRADRDCQNDSEHYRVLCHILSFVLPPYIAKKISQFDPCRAEISAGNRQP